MAPQTFDSYEEFWPYYVAMHARAATAAKWLAGNRSPVAHF